MKAFNLGAMTLASLFKRPETICYPLQEKPIPAGRKGHIVIDVETCILCGLCAKKCPAHAITVDKTTRTWSIDYLRCVQCTSCTFECPKNCLKLSAELPSAVVDKQTTDVSVPAAKA